MKKVLSVLIIAVLFFQCQKNLSYKGIGDPGVTVNSNPITASLQGRVIDENEAPAPGVTVTVGTNNFITDANGFFHANGLSLDKNTTLVTAQKDGYFKGYRVFAATSGCNQVVLKLIKRTLAGTINTSSGGTIGLSNDSKINLPANSVVTASSNNAYTGDVKVYAAYIDPTAYDIFKTIPGSLVADNKNGKRVSLLSYGMLAVELESSGGEKLQIKQGSVATLTIPIPTSAIASAPATIALWYIDEKTGVWQEEGTATKTGNSYIGTVKHFSFWNCDYSMDAVNLSMTLKTPDSLPLVNAEVRITASTTDSTRSAYGWTDSLGQVKGLVPANENLKIEVLNKCNEIVYSKDLAPLSQDADLGTINITNIYDVLSFKGVLVDCNNNPVKHGYVIINFYGETRYVASDANGLFATNFVVCFNPYMATVLGVDEDAQQQSQLITIVLTSPVTNTGNIIACGTPSGEFINYTIDDSSYSISNAINGSNFYARTDGSDTTHISGYNFLSTDYTQINFNAANTTSTGTYSLTTLGLSLSKDSSITYYPSLVQPFNITFTKFPSTSGEFYEGNFSGQYVDSLSNLHAINTTFRVRRN